MELKKDFYRFFWRKFRVFHDAKYRNYVREISADLKRTRGEVGDWGKDGAPVTYDKGCFVVISLTRVPIYAKFHTVIAKILQLAGYRPVIITQRGNFQAFEYYKMFGINDFVYWDEFEEQHVNEQELDRLTEVLFPKQFDHLQLLTIQYIGVDIGKHAMSMVCRKRLEGQLDFQDPDTIQSLKSYFRKAIASVLASKKLLEFYPVKKMLVRDSGYIPNGGLFEYALTKGVDCIVHEFGQQKGTWVFKRHVLQNKNIRNCTS